MNVSETPPAKAESDKPDGKREDSHNSQDQDDNEVDNEVQKPGLLVRIGLDAPTLIVVLKGSLPPTIGLAMYQSGVISDYFQTFGYFISIAGFMSLPVLPRGRFIVHILLCILCTAVGAAVSLLAIWTALQAGINTAGSVDPSTKNAYQPPYNASQNAVAAIWLMAATWFINVLRAKIPALSLPSVLFAIIINVACTYGPNEPTMERGEGLVRELLVSLLVGQAIATVVSLLVIPISDRMIVSGKMKAMIGLLQGAVKRQRAYIRAAEDKNIISILDQFPSKEARNLEQSRQNANGDVEMEGETKLQPLKPSTDMLLGLVGEIAQGAEFAKWEIGYGKLDGNDLSRIVELLVDIMIPIVGFNRHLDLFSGDPHERHWFDDDDIRDGGSAAGPLVEGAWKSIMHQLRDTLVVVSEAVTNGLEHGGIVLELLPRPKDAKAKAASADGDVEASAQSITPGHPEFAKTLQIIVESFHEQRVRILRAWAAERGISADLNPDDIQAGTMSHKENVNEVAQVYALLSLQKMLCSMLDGVTGFVEFADQKAASGSMKKSRLVYPSGKQIQGVLKSMFIRGDAELAVANALVHDHHFSKDPEHLPPANAWERFGTFIKGFPHFLGSEESVFALRVSLATMTIGIVGYLESTRLFFQQERIVWAMIMVAFSMTMTSGQSIFGFFLRIVGTLIGMICCYVAWYIVDGKIPGVIVFTWLFILIGFYFLIKFPRLVFASALYVVTMVLIIGYELQVDQIGQAKAEGTGQPYYPIYILAPYRLATVVGGMFVAFIWTFFPAPLPTDREWLRREISSVLFLLANYSSLTTETVMTKLRDEVAPGGHGEPSATAHRLFTIRKMLFAKVATLIPSIEEHFKFQRWELNIGGKFPRKEYEEIIMRAKRIRDYMTLTAFVVEPRNNWNTMGRPVAGTEVDKKWLAGLLETLPKVPPTRHMNISALTLLSNSIRSGQSLPPFLPLPQPFQLTRQLLELSDREQGVGIADLLDPANMEEYGFAEFAVMQLCDTHMRDDLEGIICAVSKLVGVVDFGAPDGRQPSVLVGNPFTSQNKRGNDGKAKSD